MRLISCHRGELQTIGQDSFLAARSQVFTTGFPAIDTLLPGGGFARSAIHELLSEPESGLPLFFAAMLARSALTCAPRTHFLAWCDPSGEIYPPALALAGIPLQRLLVLRPNSATDLAWAATECLRCKGISATIASLGRLSRIQARRLQLAAERGGGVGILLRPWGVVSSEYAAATRWRVQPVPGERNVQRWNLQLVHGHGGQIGRNVLLEVCRETDHVRAFEPLADRPAQAQIRQRA